MNTISFDYVGGFTVGIEFMEDEEDGLFMLIHFGFFRVIVYM